jgi:hypothetical protein
MSYFGRSPMVGCIAVQKVVPTDDIFEPDCGTYSRFIWGKCSLGDFEMLNIHYLEEAA